MCEQVHVRMWVHVHTYVCVYMETLIVVPCFNFRDRPPLEHGAR